jgi:flagellar motility protein MotE (MotC chaperone)
MLVSAMPAQRAVAVVSAMRPDLAASAMTAMDTEWAARLLAAMVPARAAVTLTAMAAPDAAGMLAAMEDPAKATRVLNEVDGTAAKAGLIVEVMRLAGVHAAVFLTLLGSDRAVPVLAALTDAQQAALLDAMQWETAQEMSNALARHRFRATGFTTP